MNKCTKILIMVCLTLLLAAVAQPALGSNWPEFQKDKINSGVTNDSAPITSPNTTISWTNDTILDQNRMAGIDVSPIVCNGFVYTVTSEGKLFKYYLNGTQVTDGWPVSFVSSPGAYEFQLATPAACPCGYIFVLDSGHQDRANPHDDLYAIDADTGVIVDSVNITDYNYTQFNTPITCTNCSNGSKHILFGSMNITTDYNTWVTSFLDGKYYCYDVTDPTNMVECWNHTSSAGYYWTGAAIIGDYAVFGNESGWLASVNKCTGSVVDEVDVSDLFNVDAQAIRSSVSYNAETERVYFTSTGGYCYALGFDDTNGEFIRNERWSTSIPTTSTSTPAYYNGKIYVGNYSSGGGSLTCLYANGTVFWSNHVGVVQSSPAISTFYGPDNEYIYVTTNNLTGGICCVDSSGNTVWREDSIHDSINPYGSLSLAGAAISGGWVFYGNDDGVIHGRANFTRYDFNGSADMWAYKYQVYTNPPNTATDPEIEFSSAEYNAIKTDDNVYASNQTTSDGYYAAHRFVFKIDDNEKPWITSINVTWNGIAKHDTEADGAYLYIWNGTGYEELTNNNVNTDATLNGEVALNIGNYIDGSNNVTVLVVQKSPQTSDEEGTHYSQIETDYVKLVVTP
ncbi:hypothetical protein ASJ81_16925 [Methanosarcina spelaei]|uniref:Pyrrolo-quinoline quinone repeat domain-containing protein n=1 Tax=Methanosarcina spelaei TaxID=1036679 RepID=A0A2A2HW42_9EURY|nr:PQQ-binding-like beta-propeller repeat protein [Methanosarcina spelaei]PAV13687.1 hypothetical protein ASJ81_16925 [Methanosarcina spelaei]